MSRAIGAAHAPQVVQQPLPPHEPEQTYTWKIENFTTKLAQAISDKDFGEIESEPFFTNHGYKMKLRVRLNQALRGYPGYMGVCIVLMKSDLDRTLVWPFTKRFTFVLVDQHDNFSRRQDVQKTIVPNKQAAFKRPWQRENEAWGKVQFVKHSTLRGRQYIRDDAVYIKILIDL